jgi:hypothetical protein
MIMIFTIAGCSEDTSSKHKYDKLDSKLNRLIEAYERGEEDEIERLSNNFDIVEGGVRVEIVTFPDQKETAAEVTRTLGTVEIVSKRFDLIQAVVPVDKLIELSNEKSIKSIRTPVIVTEAK